MSSVASDSKPKMFAAIYEPSMVRCIKRIFPDYEVEAVFTAADARAKCDALLADVVITDWTVVDGAAVVAAAQRQSVKRIIVLDGGIVPHEKRAAMEREGVLVISKPFDTEVLRRFVRERRED